MRCKADREKGILPEIKPLKSNVADYDAVFIGYPMLNAKATTVASLTILEGTEYLFTAQDMRQDVNPSDSQLTSEIQVYVIVEKGKSPEFTKVVR